MAGGFLSLTAFQAEGCGIARRAISMKSALRDWLSVSYVTQYPVPPIFSFPLEGKCHVVAKGCTGLSSDVILYRYPDRHSAASLANSWPSPPCKLGHTYGVKVLRIDRPAAGGFLSLTALQAEGCGGGFAAI